jgi:hypothetical protein
MVVLSKQKINSEEELLQTAECLSKLAERLNLKPGLTSGSGNSSK